MRYAVAAHLRIDAVGGAAQREFAQREQVALAEEVSDRALRLFGKIDLAILEALQQVVGRQIDEHRLRRLRRKRGRAPSRAP